MSKDERKNESMSVRQYARQRGRPYDTCKKIASRNSLGELVTLEHGGKQRQLSQADIEEMDRRWRA